MIESCRDVGCVRKRWQCDRVWCWAGLCRQLQVVDVWISVGILLRYTSFTQRPLNRRPGQRRRVAGKCTGVKTLKGGLAYPHPPVSRSPPGPSASHPASPSLTYHRWLARQIPLQFGWVCDVGFDSDHLFSTSFFFGGVLLLLSYSWFVLCTATTAIARLVCAPSLGCGLDS
jgi:hypothetical protein